MTEHIRTETGGGVLTLTIDRPEKKNALTRPMYQALGARMEIEGRHFLTQLKSPEARAAFAAFAGKRAKAGPA